MRILRILATTLSVMLILASCQGSDASAVKVSVATPGAPASKDEIAALVQQFGLGGGEKDVAGEAFHNLAQRAAPGLLEIARDPATNVNDLETILFIASVYVPEPEIFQTLRCAS